MGATGCCVSAAIGSRGRGLLVRLREGGDGMIEGVKEPDKVFIG